MPATETAIIQVELHYTDAMIIAGQLKVMARSAERLAGAMSDRSASGEMQHRAAVLDDHADQLLAPFFSQEEIEAISAHAE